MTNGNLLSWYKSFCYPLGERLFQKRTASNVAISNFDLNNYLDYEKLKTNISIVKDRYRPVLWD